MQKVLMTVFVAIGVMLVGGPPGLAATTETPPQDEPPKVHSNRPAPKTGMTMRQVEKQYGSPSEIIGPIGKPAITRWVYNDFTVYFENNLVIHSVIPNALRVKSKIGPGVRGAGDASTDPGDVLVAPFD